MKRFKSNFLVVAFILSNVLLWGQTLKASVISSQSATLLNKKIELSPLFTNHMVIQREKPVIIWGKTAPNNQVQVNINNVGKVVTSDANGYFETTFDPLPVGGPYELQISGNDTTIHITNILSGDVWLCGGQSNMAWQLINEQHGVEESANSNYPNLRSIRLMSNVELEPVVNDPRQSRWLVSNQTSANLFSAIGYYFGRTLHVETNIPIGLIGTNWGGSTVEAWISEEGLSEFKEFKPFFDELSTGSLTLEDLEQRATDSLTRRQEGKLVDIYAPLAMQHYPSLTYNGMIAPIQKFPMKGVIWYQGENNVARAWQYQFLFPALINDWRTQFNNPDMPFYFVQLPGYGLIRDYPHESQWAELRDAQNKALYLPNTEMVVTLDVGDSKDIHPKDKRTVGYRLANLALKNLYGMTNLHPEFPQLKTFTVEGNAIICEFDNVGTGLVVEGGELTEFTIAGENEVFNRANAEIIAPNKIRLSSEYVPAPIAVRYAWSYFPINGLVFNSYGLPLGTFRTDSWRVSTQPAVVNPADTITMQTAKAANSEITLVVAAEGPGELFVDWGDGSAQLVENVSTNVGKPTTITGVTKVDQAEIKIFTKERSILYLTCASNEIDNLNISKASQLQYLRCNTNNLKSIDLSTNKELLTLHIHHNSLTSLDVSNNQKLTDLQFGTNKISTFTGLDKLTALRVLSAMINPLGEIDVSFNPALRTLNLRNCGLTKLDVSKATSALTTVEVFNGGNTYSNRFSACGLDSLYHSLPDRTGMTKGVVRVIYSNANPLNNDGVGSNKDIANAKNWEVMTYAKEVLTGDGGGCPAPSGLKNTSVSKNVLELTPNPASSMVQIQIPTSVSSEKLKIYNTLGKKIKEVTLDMANTSILLDISSYPQGVYMLYLGDYSGKLIKH